MGRDYRGTHVIDSKAYDSTSGVSPDLAASLRGRPGVELVSASRVTRAAVAGADREEFFAFEPQTMAQLTTAGLLSNPSTLYTISYSGTTLTLTGVGNCAGIAA